MTAKQTTEARVHSTPGIKLQKRDNRIWDCQARFRPFRNMSHKVDIRAAGRPRDMGVSPNQFLVDMLTHGRTADAFRYVLPPINWWPFCSEQLQRQIIYARIFKRNWLIPSPIAIYIYNLRKQWKWHGCTSFLGCFFIAADRRAKSAQQLISTVLPFHAPYIFHGSYLNHISTGEGQIMPNI